MGRIESILECLFVCSPVGKKKTDLIFVQHSLPEKSRREEKTQQPDRGCKFKASIEHKLTTGLSFQKMIVFMQFVLNYLYCHLLVGTIFHNGTKTNTWTFSYNCYIYITVITVIIVQSKSSEASDIRPWIGEWMNLADRDDDDYQIWMMYGDESGMDYEACGDGESQHLEEVSGRHQEAIINCWK